MDQLTFSGSHFDQSIYEAPADLEALRDVPEPKTPRRAVLTAFVKAKKRGLTDEELSGRVKVGYHQMQKCRLELLQGGWIYDSSLRRPVLETGNLEAVWKITDRAKDL